MSENSENKKPTDETVKCRYCRKEIPKDKAVIKKIWVNRGTVMEIFCSGDCAGYYQMGCEG